jgi:hypothetical protein
MIKRKFGLNITMTTTALVTTIVVLGLGIYDLIAVTVGGDTSLSVSRFLINIGFDSPMFVFATGWVGGHVFGFARPVRAKDLPCEDPGSPKTPKT